MLLKMQDAGIKVSTISGSSLGGLLAGMYAFEPDAEKVHKKACDFFANSRLFGGARKQDKKDGLRGGLTIWGRIRKYLRTAFVFNILAARSSLLKRNPARKAVEALLEDKDIKD
ncbi:MAG: hypothetical protein ACYTFY_14335, partial [Planctomycetota bacterium]